MKQTQLYETSKVQRAASMSLFMGTLSVAIFVGLSASSGGCVNWRSRSPMALIEFGIPALLYAIGYWYMYRLVLMLKKKTCPDCTKLRDAEARLGRR